MPIKTTRGIRNIHYRNLYQSTQHSEVITSPSITSQLTSSSHIPLTSQYAPFPDSLPVHSASSTAQEVEDDGWASPNAPFDCAPFSPPTDRVIHPLPVRPPLSSLPHHIGRHHKHSRPTASEGEQQSKMNRPTLEDLQEMIESMKAVSSHGHGARSYRQPIVEHPSISHAVPPVTAQKRTAPPSAPMYTSEDVGEMLAEQAAKYQLQLKEGDKKTLSLAKDIEALQAGRGRESELVVRVEQLTQDLQAAQAIATKTTATSGDYNRLQAKLDETEQALGDEKKKRADAEMRERSAIAGLSSTAKAKHEVEVQLARAKAETEQEKVMRQEIENRHMSWQKRSTNGERDVQILQRRIDDLGVQNHSLKQQTTRDAELNKSLRIEKDKFVDKIKMMRMEMEGLRHRIGELQIKEQAEQRLLKDKENFRKRVSKQEDEIKVIIKEAKSWRRKADSAEKDRLRLKQELADYHSQAVISRDSRVTKDSHSGSTHRGAHRDPEEMPSRRYDADLYHPAPIPRTLADIPSILASSVNNSSSYARSEHSILPDPAVSPSILSTSTHRRTLADLREALAPKRPVDPYVRASPHTSQEAQVQANLSNAFANQFGETDPPQAALDEPPRGHDMQIEEDLLHRVHTTPQEAAPIPGQTRELTEWEKMYGQVTATVLGDGPFATT